MTYFLYWLINDLALKLLIWISRQFHTRRKCQAKFYQILPKHCYYFASDTPTIAVEPHSFRKFSLALEVWATHYPKVSDDAGWLSTTRFPVCMDPKLNREKSSWYGLSISDFWTWYYQIRSKLNMQILWHRKNSVTIWPITIRSCYSYITLSMTCPIKGLSLMRTSTLDDCLIVSNSCLRITIDYDLGPEKSIEFWFYWAARNLKEREQEGELAYSGGDLHKLNEIQKLQYYTYTYIVHGDPRWFGDILKSYSLYGFISPLLVLLWKNA